MAFDDDAVGLDAVGEVVTEAEKAEEEDALADFQLSLKNKKKKKKKKPKKTEEESTDGTDAIDQTADGKYTYNQMLDRIFELLHKNNPNLAKKRTYNMIPPQLGFVGSKKTMWSNFQEICNLMKRSMEHVMNYFMIELGTQGSLDKNSRMVVKGRFKANQIQAILKKYIVEYVRCHNCRTPETTLERDQMTRLHFLKCNNCGASRSVAPMKQLFHATSRADRRHAKRTGA